MKRSSRGILGSFPYVDSAVEAIRDLKKAGFETITVMSPIPHHEIEEALGKKESHVRFFTLIGAILGCISGFALTIYTAVVWPLPTGGKPIISIPPYIIIAFELTILLGALANLLGFLITGRLPNFFRKKMYDKRFCEDRIGIFVSCEEDKMPEVEEILRTSGAEEIHHEQG